LLQIRPEKPELDSPLQVDYHIKAGYRERAQPEYWIDEDLNAVWQPDVYADAAALGDLLGARTIVDVGCGTAAKLAELHGRFELVGIDYGPNIESCRERYAFGTWLEADFESDGPLPATDFEHALLVCADVIEHLVAPERLLRRLRLALDQGAGALLLSTPERDLKRGVAHMGPPPHAAHVREWCSEELQQFMAAEGLDGHFGLTRSNDRQPTLSTIFAAIPGLAPAAQAAVARWFAERARWERLAVEQDNWIRALRSSKWTRVGFRIGAVRDPARLD
jgi:SAM-dependent methyltransferase